VEKLDGLEDIDELCVEEIGAISKPNGLHSSFSKGIQGRLNDLLSMTFIDEASTSEIQISMTPTTRTGAQVAPVENGDTIQEDDEDEKYNKRSSLLKRISQRIFSNAFAPTLPLTNK